MSELSEQFEEWWKGLVDDQQYEQLKKQIDALKPIAFAAWQECERRASSLLGEAATNKKAWDFIRDVAEHHTNSPDCCSGCLEEIVSTARTLVSEAKDKAV